MRSECEPADDREGRERDRDDPVSREVVCGDHTCGDDRLHHRQHRDRGSVGARDHACQARRGDQRHGIPRRVDAKGVAQGDRHQWQRKRRQNASHITSRGGAGTMPGHRGHRRGHEDRQQERVRRVGRRPRQSDVESSGETPDPRHAGAAKRPELRGLEHRSQPLTALDRESNDRDGERAQREPECPGELLPSASDSRNAQKRRATSSCADPTAETQANPHHAAAANETSPQTAALHAISRPMEEEFNAIAIAGRASACSTNTETSVGILTSISRLIRPGRERDGRHRAYENTSGAADASTATIALPGDQARCETAPNPAVPQANGPSQESP